MGRIKDIWIDVMRARELISHYWISRELQDGWMPAFFEFHLEDEDVYFWTDYN